MAHPGAPAAAVVYEGKDLEAMAFAQNYHRWIADFFAPYLGKKVGEVGAGSGNFSSFLLESPVESLLAVEPSAQMFPLLAEKFKHEPRVVARQALFRDVCGAYAGQLDSLVYVNVLEHIEDDARELACAYEALKEGGYLLIFVPALPALYSEFDASVGHFRHYRKRALVRLVGSAGFSVTKVRYFDMAGILPWFVAMRLMRGGLNPRNTGLYDRFAVPVVRAFESVIPVPLGKNIILVARKQAAAQS